MRRISFLAILASLFATSLLANPAAADHQKALLEVHAHAAQSERGYLLHGHLATSDGKPVGDASVTFYEIVELFGRREMLIGTAKTDGQGVAGYPYLPARTGTHEILVRFRGRDHVSPADSTLTFEATVAAPARSVARPALADFSDRVPYAVGAIVLAVWALIAFALFGTARGVIRARADPIGKEDSA